MDTREDATYGRYIFVKTITLITLMTRFTYLIRINTARNLPSVHGFFHPIKYTCSWVSSHSLHTHTSFKFGIL